MKIYKRFIWYLIIHPGRAAMSIIRIPSFFCYRERKAFGPTARFTGRHLDLLLENTIGKQKKTWVPSLF